MMDSYDGQPACTPKLPKSFLMTDPRAMLCLHFAKECSYSLHVGAWRMGCAHGVATSDSRSRAKSSPTKSTTIMYSKPCHTKRNPAARPSSRPQLLEPTMCASIDLHDMQFEILLHIRAIEP
eukprot:848650-Amphidinium_carterae.1